MDWDGKKGNEDNVGWGLKAGIDSCKESMKKRKLIIWMKWQW